MSEGASGAAATVLLVWEDSSKQGEAIMRSLLRAVIRYLDPQAEPEQLKVEPTEKELRAAAKPSSWPASEMHAQRAKMAQRIATTLKHARGFVVFHADGDARWNEHQKSPSLNHTRFDSIVRIQIKQLLGGTVASARKAQAVKARAKGQPAPEAPSQAEVDRWLSKLFLWMPFYSIESWLYSSRDRAKALCTEHHRNCSGERSIGDILEKNPLIDDVHMPKDNCCLTDAHNRDLAESFTAGLVERGVAQGASMAEAVKHMREHPEWMAALLRARPAWCQPSPEAAQGADGAEGQADGGSGPGGERGGGEG